MTDERAWVITGNLLISSALENNLEKSLEIEDWMTCNDSWAITGNVVAVSATMEIDAEKSLEVESWMTSDKSWAVNKNAVEPSNVLETYPENKSNEATVGL